MKLSVALRSVLDVALPPTCGLCRAEVADAHALCPVCWRQLEFLAPPWCDCCGHPFAVAVEGVAACPACLTDPPPFSQARAALSYNDAARALVGRFKYQDQMHLAPTFQPWLLRAGREVLAGAEVIVPLPLYWLRLFGRRYNQAAVLAKGLGVPVALGALVRVRRTRPQVGLKRGEREQNVRGAFAVKDKAAIAGKVVLLVDDVMTTGATIREATEALLKGGAAEVRVLTLARVVGPQQIT